MKVKIVGLRIEKYVGQEVSGHNCAFEYTDVVMDKHVICATKENGEKIEITLSEEYGECGSGWTSASWAYMEIEKVEKFNGFTHKPVEKLIIDEDYLKNQQYIDNGVFSLSFDGGDSYYPSGYYSVNMDLFKEGLRHKNKRPVWIFTGDSGKGKSHIASKLTVGSYETDSNEELPDVIYEDVIVLGNKYQFSLEDVQERIMGEHELILVNFE